MFVTSSGRMKRSPKSQALNPRFTTKTLKNGEGKLMVWGGFSWYGVGPIVRIDGIMDRFQYLDILKKKMEEFLFKNMTIKWIFQQDNEPKLTAKVVKKWLKDEKINVMEWPKFKFPIRNLRI